MEVNYARSFCSIVHFLPQQVDIAFDKDIPEFNLKLTIHGFREPYHIVM